MVADHTVTLSEAISAQPNGIILAWSAYADGEAQDYDWVYTFIPKYHVLAHSGTGVQCHMSHASSYWVGGKYIYVNDTSISGHRANSWASESSPINYNNGYWGLRYVIGV